MIFNFFNILSTSVNMSFIPFLLYKDINLFALDFKLRFNLSESSIGFLVFLSIYTSLKYCSVTGNMFCNKKAFFLLKHIQIQWYHNDHISVYSYHIFSDTLPLDEKMVSPNK